MKKLFIVRHAKSGWDAGALSDFDRVLNEQGHLDAQEMGNRFFSRNIVIDVFISSPAKRAFTTACYFAKKFEKTEKDVVLVSELYQANANIFFETIETIDDKQNNVAIFSHNPGITDFVNQLTKTQIDDMPTCGVFAVEIDIKSWKEFKKTQKKFLFFDYPASF